MVVDKYVLIKNLQYNVFIADDFDLLTYLT